MGRYYLAIICFIEISINALVARDIKDTTQMKNHELHISDRGSTFYYRPNGDRTYVNVVRCAFCGGQTHQDKGKGHHKPFCSFECRSRYFPRTEDKNPMWGKKHPNPYDRRGDKNPNWNGGVQNQGGYKAITKGGQYQRIHRLNAEKAMGRKLTSKEIVHHINLDKQDNRNSNLLVCDASYHFWLHGQLAKAWVKHAGL